MKTARSGSQGGFTLLEVLVAALVLGIISIGAVRLYTTTFGAQLQMAREFDLRQTAEAVFDEIARGFEFGGNSLPGVYGAREVKVRTGPPEIVLTGAPGQPDVIYTWSGGTKQLLRRVGTGSSTVLLERVERFSAVCENGLVRLELDLLAEDSPSRTVSVSTSLRPRVADPECT